MSNAANADPVHGCSFCKPEAMVLFGMQDAEDDDAVAFDAIEQFVGEPAKERPSKIAVVNRITFGIPLK